MYDRRAIVEVLKMNGKFWVSLCLLICVHLRRGLSFEFVGKESVRQPSGGFFVVNDALTIKEQ